MVSSFIIIAFGPFASAKWDFSTGASVVIVFGLILVICAAIKYAFTLTKTSYMSRFCNGYSKS